MVLTLPQIDYHYFLWPDRENSGVSYCFELCFVQFCFRARRSAVWLIFRCPLCQGPQCNPRGRLPPRPSVPVGWGSSRHECRAAPPWSPWTRLRPGLRSPHRPARSRRNSPYSSAHTSNPEPLRTSKLKSSVHNRTERTPLVPRQVRPRVHRFPRVGRGPEVVTPPDQFLPSVAADSSERPAASATNSSAETGRPLSSLSPSRHEAQTCPMRAQCPGAARCTRPRSESAPCARLSQPNRKHAPDRISDCKLFLSPMIPHSFMIPNSIHSITSKNYYRNPKTNRSVGA